jgi:hypothetical protein
MRMKLPPQFFIEKFEKIPILGDVLSEADHLEDIGGGHFGLRRNVRMKINGPRLNKDWEMSFKICSMVRKGLEVALSSEIALTQLSYRSGEEISILLGKNFNATVRVEMDPELPEVRLDYFVVYYESDQMKTPF